MPLHTYRWQVQAFPFLLLPDIDIIDDLHHAGGCGVKAENNRLLHIQPQSMMCTSCVASVSILP